MRCGRGVVVVSQRPFGVGHVGLLEEGVRFVAQSGHEVDGSRRRQ